MIWKDIPNWEEYYEINNYGEVRNKKSKNILIGDKNSSGYMRVCLYNKNRKFRFFRHIMVAKLFLDNPNNFKEVNHIDGNKENNNMNNLEFCDRKHNEREAHRIGIKEYKPFIVNFNTGECKKYEFAIDLAIEINVTKRTVLNYLQGKSKGYLNKNISSIKYL